MPILTLTTDWGTNDHYLAAFKGSLLAQISNLTMVDVSHSVDKHSITQASYLLGNSYSYFPEGTLHFIGVRGNEEKRKEFPYVIIQAKNHFFLGHDSGIFTLLLGEAEKKVIHLPISNKQHLKKIELDLVQAIHTYFNNGFDFESAKDEKLFEQYTTRATIGANYIGASVMYIDSFGNGILNVNLELFESIRKGRSFTFHYFRADLEFTELRYNYDEVESGDALLLVNQDNYLQISLNQGSAAQLLGLKVNEQVRIEFS